MKVRVKGYRFRVTGLGLGLGLRVKGYWLRATGFGLRVRCCLWIAAFFKLRQNKQLWSQMKKSLCRVNRRQVDPRRYSVTALTLNP